MNADKGGEFRQVEGGRYMGGENRQFTPGQKAPNNGIYIEIGETGGMVKDPKQIELRAGEQFPECSNQNRKWSREPKPHH